MSQQKEGHVSKIVLKFPLGILSIVGIFLGLGLSACAPKMTLESDAQSVGMLPNSATSTSSPSASANQNTVSHQVHTKVVTQYVPVPVPGQLMQAPLQTPSSTSSLQGEKAVASATQNAIVTPSSGNFFNAMTSYDFMPGALYTVYTAPMRITDITLAPGEKMISNAAGDTLRWQVSQTYSGQGDQIIQHILIKPELQNLDNTMVINTDQRVYHLILKSTSNDTYMVSVSWRYPQNLTQLGSSSSPEAAAGGNTAASALDENYGLNLNNLDFNYQFGVLKGGKPDWYPVRVFNNGRQTFIQFPPHFSASDTPVLYVADNNGVYGTMVNWRLKGPYMIVDAVIQKARLQIGIEKTGQTIVQIQHV